MNNRHHSAKIVKYKDNDCLSTKHPLYSTWEAMKQRCYDKKAKNYHLYGGRGIRVCDRWLDKYKGFKNFIEDIGDKPEPYNKYSLDRKDVNGNYEKNNCRWATWSEQQTNKRISPVSGHNFIYLKNNTYTYRRVIDKKVITLKSATTLEDTISIGKKFEELLNKKLDYSYLLSEKNIAEYRSNIPGVYWRSDKQMWRVRRKYNGKKINLGTYLTIEESESIALEWDKRILENKSVTDMIIKRKLINNKSKYQGIYFNSKDNTWAGTITILGKNFTTKSKDNEEDAYLLIEEIKHRYNYIELNKIKEIDFDFKKTCYRITACRLVQFTPILIGYVKTKEEAENYLQYIYSDSYKNKYYHELNNIEAISIYHPVRREEIIYIKVHNTEYYKESISFVK